MTISTATLKDTEQILDILFEIATDLKAKQIIQWQEWLAPSREDLQWINNLIKNDSFYLILNDSTTIGIFSLSDSDQKYWGKSVDNSKYLHSLAVLPSYKKYQFGKNVINLIKADLKTKGYDYLRLDCISSNQKLKNYYSNQEFNEVGLTTIGSHSFTLFEYTI